MLLLESTDIPRYLVGSFERSLRRGLQVEASDTMREEAGDRRLDLELPSLMRGIQLAGGEAPSEETVREYLFDDEDSE